MRYVYTFEMVDSIYMYFGKDRSFFLSRSGNLIVRPSSTAKYINKNVTGNFGVMFGCNVIEVEYAGGKHVRIHSPIRITRLMMNPSTELIVDPPTDAEQKEAADAHLKQCEAWEDGQAVVDKEDWTMVTA